jgi:hypothetical protein
MRWKERRNSQCPHHFHAPSAHDVSRTRNSTEITVIVMTLTLYQITVKQAVMRLIDDYGNDAGFEASRRASHARIAGHRDDCRFWEAVLQILEPVSKYPQIH